MYHFFIHVIAHVHSSLHYTIAQVHDKLHHVTPCQISQESQGEKPRIFTDVYQGENNSQELLVGMGGLMTRVWTKRIKETLQSLIMEMYSKVEVLKGLKKFYKK